MKHSREVKVGLLAVIALAIIYAGLNFLKGQELFSTGNVYYTVYENSSGLKTSSPILVKGMVIGRVKKIAVLPEKNYSALITFKTEKHIRLTDATQANLVSPSLLGAKAIELLIEPGNPLKSYDTIPSCVEPSLGETFTQTALPALNEAKAISLVTNKFVSNIAENTEKINAIFTNLEATTKMLKHTIATSEEDLRVLSRSLAEVAGALSDRKDGVRPLLTKLNKLTDGVQGEEVVAVAAKLNNILGNIENVLDKTSAGKNCLSKLINEDEFYNNLNQTIVDLDNLLVDLQAHPWRYVSFSIFGGKQKR